MELTLEISDTWEPVPDVAGMPGPYTDEIYQSAPAAVVIEILSPSDRFMTLDEKCRRYAEWGVKDILALDPASLRAWYWDPAAEGLVYFDGSYRFRSKPDAELSLANAFGRLPS
jgi:Uma2 family endonuclease